MIEKTNALILIVEDEPQVRAVLRQALEGDGYRVVEADNKIDALEAFDREAFALVTLDIKLQQSDGLELARVFRAKRNVPVVMITGLSAVPDRLAGLEYGADDYIAKPFHIREVLLRIRNILNRYTPAPAETSRVYRFDSCSLDPRKRALTTAEGEEVDLTDYEFRLLSLLVANPGRVLSRQELSKTLNGHDWSPLDRTIDGHIARLRRKVEPRDEAPRLIKSVRNIGYVFAGEATPD